jgi:phage terminase large subunit GpA
VTAHPIVAFAADVLHFTLRPRQAAILDEIYRDGIRTAVLRLGRRSGKGRMAAVVATYEATVNAAVHLAAVLPGEGVMVIVVASSQRQARTVHGYIRSFLRRSPDLARLIDDRAAGGRDTKDEIRLTNGVTIVTLPANAAAVRSYAAAVVILDEAAHFQGTDGSLLDVAELWRAIVPTTAQFPERRVMVLSTPRYSTGWFAELCEKAASGLVPTMRHWHATTAEMDPSLERFLAEAMAEDPGAFAREYLAEFVGAISAVFDAELVRAATKGREATMELPPEPRQEYVVSIDAAAVHDAFVAMIGHKAQDGRIVVDRIRTWRGSKAAPVRFEQTFDEIADLAKSYNGATALLDQWAGEVLRQRLVARGVDVVLVPWTNESKLEAVTATRRSMYAGRLSIPPHRQLVAELHQLEQRPTPSGRPHIAGAAGGPDDHAMALLQLCLRLEPETIGILQFYRQRKADQDDPVAALRRKLEAEQARPARPWLPS